MIKTVNVLDLKRGDTVVIVEGHGKHRGGSADMGCIDITEVAIQTSAMHGTRTRGEHARRRPMTPYVSFEGRGNYFTEADVFSVPSDTELVVLR